MNEILQKDHLPFKMPSRKHSLNQEWRFLTFMHWEVSSVNIAPYLPEGLELDLFDGKAYVSVIPFMMKNVRPRLGLPLPGISNFPEFNIRTYVKKNNKPGVLFLTLDAQSYITCFYAPFAYGLPYQYSKGKVSTNGDSYNWKSKRSLKGFELAGSSKKKGTSLTSNKGSLEEFLFERYCLYTIYQNKICIGHTHHNPWVFYNAEVEIISNNLMASYNLGITNLLKPDLAHMSDGLFVNSWSLDNTY